MEKHRCKLCCRRFSNGRALGGHMRSHMLALPIPPKSHHSISFSSGEEEEEEENYSKERELEIKEEGEEEEKAMNYELRENPKRSFRLSDPEFSFTSDHGGFVVHVQDRESETESSKNTIRRRSKRTRNLNFSDTQKQKSIKKLNSSQNYELLEHGSSVSDTEDASTTPEEDVALSLIMLSKDIWKRNNEKFGGDFKCRTCNKVFGSYQALGGHRLGHKKKMTTKSHSTKNVGAGVNVVVAHPRKVYECPFCDKVFESGQAMGGHKRSHFTTTNHSANNNVVSTNSSAAPKFKDHLIDLNLPAPIEDDPVSQIEVSAVSDAEFVKVRHNSDQF
ncbi:hypothetical protein RJ641_035335 [Dillenia turbinata]|uniref:C2H2-type domain-containing protein n=1 Tax=Dillenia turbinata TaxID=194707 RepID=A0AAN8VJF1_9MAGN